MPCAVWMKKEETKELKTLPKAYVIIRRMKYGEKLVRDAEAMEITAKTGGNKDGNVSVKLLTEATALWEFANLIVDHNLEDEHGNKLNFKNFAHTKMLDPKVGSEISNYIDELNSWEDDEELKN